MGTKPHAIPKLVRRLHYVAFPEETRRNDYVAFLREFEKIHRRAGRKTARRWLTIETTLSTVRLIPDYAKGAILRVIFERLLG